MHAHKLWLYNNIETTGGNSSAYNWVKKCFNFNALIRFTVATSSVLYLIINAGLIAVTVFFLLKKGPSYMLLHWPNWCLLYKCIVAGCSGEEKMLWSTNHGSAGLECNYKSIMRCWGQQEQDMQGRTAQTLLATRLLYISATQAAQPPPTHLPSSSWLW